MSCGSKAGTLNRLEHWNAFCPVRSQKSPAPHLPCGTLAGSIGCGSIGCGRRGDLGSTGLRVLQRSVGGVINELRADSVRAVVIALEVAVARAFARADLNSGRHSRAEECSDGEHVVRHEDGRGIPGPFVSGRRMQRTSFSMIPFLSLSCLTSVSLPLSLS